MKVLITGTHFTPAVATIEQLKKITEVEIVYVGRKTTLEGDKTTSVESQILPSLGVKFIPIIAGRLQRDFTIYTIPSLLKIPIGLLQALYIILSQKPDVILSFGGYVAVPQIIVGWLFSIPIIIHEQTLSLGLANKISSYFADKIALSFQPIRKAEDKVVITGNPLRSIVMSSQSSGFKIFEIAKKEKLPVLLVTGGNQGSHVINLALEESLNKLTKIACVIHITGDNKFRDFEKLQSLGEFEGKYLVKKWIGKEYGVVLQKVDLVISRAGINTLTELAVLGKPTLLIPIPNNEQKNNAKYFEQAGLAEVLPQSRLSEDVLITHIKLMLKNLDNLKAKSIEAKKVIIPDAAKRLALETILLVKNPD